MWLLDPFGNPLDPYFRTMVEAIREYTEVAKSHAVQPWKRDRMLYLLRLVDALVRTPQAEQRDPKVLDKINVLLDDVMALSPVPPRRGTRAIVNTGDVVPRQPSWQLVPEGPLYYVRAPGQGEALLATGPWVFVVLMLCPWEVRLGNRATGGHTAVSRGADVYFAGEVEFEDGRLMSWNNDSGHYRPASELHSQVLKLLPLSQYKQKF